MSTHGPTKSVICSRCQHLGTFAIENIAGRYPVVDGQLSESGDGIEVGESGSDDEGTSEDAFTKGVRVLEWAEAGFLDLRPDEN